jgi:hypothetical protein
MRAAEPVGRVRSLLRPLRARTRARAILVPNTAAITAFETLSRQRNQAGS